MRGVLGVASGFIVVSAACTSHPLTRMVVADAEVTRADALLPEDGRASTPDGEPVLDRTDIAVPELGRDSARESIDLPADGGGAALGDVPLGQDGSDTADDIIPRDTVVDADAFAPPADVASLEAPDAAPSDSSGLGCGIDAGSGVVRCDDFSNSGLQPTRTALPWEDLTGMTVVVTGGTAVIQDPGSWSSSYVQEGSAMDFRDTSLEVDMTAATASRSYSYVIWGGPPTYISSGLQRDEQSLYLYLVVNDSVKTRLSANCSMAPNKTQRFALEIHADGRIRCLVDDVVILTTTQDLSAYPTMLPPGIGANSYPSQKFTFDNLVVRKLAGP